MLETYDQVSKNILKNLHNINVALENGKIESKVLTPGFTEKIEKLKNVLTDNNTSVSSTSQLSPSFNSSEHTKYYTRQEINDAFARIKALPKEFAPPPAIMKEKLNKKPIGKSLSNVSVVTRSNLVRVASLQTFNENMRSNSRSNSLQDITVEPVPKVEELLEKINENKKMLEGIKSSALKYPDTNNFGSHRFKLASEFKEALAEITDIVGNLEQSVKSLKKEDVDLVLDEELNELLEQFTKTIKEYHFLQQNSNIDMGSDEHELEFPYAPLLNELKLFLDKY